MIEPFKSLVTTFNSRPLQKSLPEKPAPMTMFWYFGWTSIIKSRSGVSCKKRLCLKYYLKKLEQHIFTYLKSVKIFMYKPFSRILCGVSL